MARSRRRPYKPETEIGGDRELKNGDHVYVWREGGRYGHHGICVGDGMIIDFNSGGKLNGGNPFEGPGIVRKGSRGNFADEQELLYLYEYGVRPEDFKNRRAGTCTTAKSDDAELVKYRAEYLLTHGYGTYDLLNNNCEDFALYCKTGLVVNGGRGSSSQAVFPNIFTPVGWKAFLTRWFDDGVVFDDEYRYLCDIGVRKDKQRIGVRGEPSTEAPVNGDRIGVQNLRCGNIDPAICITEQPRASAPPDELVDKVHHAMEQRLEESDRRMRIMEDRQEAMEGNQKIILEELKRKANLETILIKKINTLIVIITIMTILMAIMATMLSTRDAFTKQSSPNALPPAGPLSLV